jgi:hypothetical protein
VLDVRTIRISLEGSHGSLWEDRIGGVVDGLE